VKGPDPNTPLSRYMPTHFPDKPRTSRNLIASFHHSSHQQPIANYCTVSSFNPSIVGLNQQTNGSTTRLNFHFDYDRSHSKHIWNQCACVEKKSGNKK
jgi:hypothetical protein